MMTMIKANWTLGNFACNQNISKELNEAYAAGYRFVCNGNFRVLDSIDPWSGMANTTADVFAFTSINEADAFASEQEWVNPEEAWYELGYGKQVHVNVYAIPAHTMDWTETIAADAAMEQAKKAKKLARDAEKAAALGMTVEEYTRRKKESAKARRYEREADKMEDEIKRLMEEIEWRRRRAAEIKAELGE